MHGGQLHGLVLRAEGQAVVEDPQHQDGQPRGCELQSQWPPHALDVALEATPALGRIQPDTYQGQLFPQRAQDEDHEHQHPEEHARAQEGLLQAEALFGGNHVHIAESHGHGLIQLIDSPL